MPNRHFIYCLLCYYYCVITVIVDAEDTLVGKTDGISYDNLCSINDKLYNNQNK